LQRPNGVTTSYSYDTVNRLSRLLHRNGQSQAIEDYQYTYTVDDEIASITSLASVSLLPQATTVGAANPANRISQVGSASYTFDHLGQTTAKTDASGTTQYNWDARGRMTSAGLPNGQSISYGYDALGRRASRTANGQTTNFLYDGSDVVLDRTTDGSIVDYLNGSGIDEKLRQRASNGGANPQYFLTDHLGSTTALTDATGGVVERQSYEPFGNSPGSGLTRYGYTGRELDSQTGLMYYRARWYDPQQSRFLSEDPIGFAGGDANFYAYVGNDPVNAIDPSGLEMITYDSNGHFVSPYAYGGGPVSAPYEVADSLDELINCWEEYLNSLPGMSAWNRLSNWWNRNFPNLRVANPRELAGLLRGTTDMLRVGTTAQEVYRNGEGGWGAAYAVAVETKRVADLFTLLAGGAQGMRGRPPQAPQTPDGPPCFLAGTKVATPDGEKNIEEIKVGDYVLAVDGEGDKPQPQRVTEVFRRESKVLLDLKVEGEVIKTTPEHRFWVEGQGWVVAGELTVGTKLLTKAGKIVYVQAIKRHTSKFTVYNFEVEKAHTYFVGKLSVLVHNQYDSERTGLAGSARISKINMVFMMLAKDKYTDK
jgi:RHS repeat-associated protein